MLGSIKIVRARTSAARARAAVCYKAQSAVTRINNTLVGTWGSAKWENKATNGKSKDNQPARNRNRPDANRTKEEEINLRALATGAPTRRYITY